MERDRRLLKNEERIEELRRNVPEWIKRLERPATPALIPKFGPLEGVRVVSTGVLIAEPYIGTKLGEFGAEVIHVERPGGDNVSLHRASRDPRATHAWLR
jgi:crotonobetainyl-CoA:carnitine CoA-transferase CaiB-like acyl-CoA transferase